MTWKAYAAVSGATVFAGWLASTPPANRPDTSASAARAPRGAAAEPAADIQQQADRLQTRLRSDRSYAPPERNPFRFEEGGNADAGIAERGTAFEPERDADPDPPVDAAPPPPPLTLAGIAEDPVSGGVARTAIVSSPSGVELLREGDVLSGYRVARIESEAVELVSVADGSIRRLTLKR